MTVEKPASRPNDLSRKPDASRSSAPTTGFLRQSALIERSRATRTTVRGVEWISDGYVIARADLFVTPPKDGKDALPVPSAAARKVLDSARGEGTRLYDARATLTGGRWQEGQAWLLYGQGRSVALNAKAAEEWLRHEWDAIEQGQGPAVRFWQKRRGKSVLVGLVMPLFVAHARFTIDTLDGAA